MIAKVYEEYGYNNITKKYDGEFSSLVIDIKKHNKINATFVFYNSREISTYGYLNCLFSNSSIIYKNCNIKKLFLLLTKEIKKINKKWNINIDKIIFKQDYGNIKILTKYLKKR